MKLADEIRKYVITQYISPARDQGKVTVILRAGNIHKEMGLVNRMPSVCEALDTEKFRAKACVQLRWRSGPDRGSNAEWEFLINR